MDFPLLQVIVRMRPVCPDKDEGDPTVQKVSNDSLSINGHNFTFDFVADTWATQAGFQVGFLFSFMISIVLLFYPWLERNVPLTRFWPQGL